MKPKVWGSLAVALLAAISATLFFSEDLRSMMLPHSQTPESKSPANPQQGADPADRSAAASRPATPAKLPDGLETATFGSGCFWCTEAVFQRLKGVASVKSGYSGGEVENPTYHEICTGTTGHAEVVQVTYDPDFITFAELLEVFWKLHDPTTLNRQGHDTGTQYRSAIFYHSDQQKELAEHYKEKLDKSGAYSNPIVTEITPYSTFYPAENYHQNYFQEHGSEPYCRAVIVPKMNKLKQAFAEKLK